MQANCIMLIKESTKKKLAKFKLEHEKQLLKGKERRFISWDDVIDYLLEGKK